MSTPRRSNIALISITALLVAAAALTLAIVMVAKGGQTGSADALVLRDHAGHERVRLLASDSGGSIELLDESGQARASLKQEGEVVVLELDPGSTGLLEIDDRVSSSTVKVAASDGGGVTVTTPHGSVALVASPISTMLELGFGDQQAKLELSEHRAELSIDGKDLAPSSP